MKNLPKYPRKPQNLHPHCLPPKYSIATQPSGHMTNLRRRQDVVDSSQDSSQQRRRFVVVLHPYDVAERRIYDESTTNCDVAVSS